MVWLIFGHFIGVFGLQSEWIVLNKAKYRYLLFVHAMIWTACVCGGLAIANRDVHLWQIVFLCSGHYVCDKWKLTRYATVPTWHFYVDQAWHIFQCVFVFYIGK